MALHYSFMVQRFLLRLVLLAAIHLVLPRLDVASVSDSVSDMLTAEPHFLKALSLPRPLAESEENIEPPEKEGPHWGHCGPTLPQGGVVHIAHLDWASALSST